MIEIAQNSQRSRSDLFSATASELNLSPAIIEKDYWICWMLSYLFGKSSVCEHICFKGGTSLSKGYDLIKRMSEDIDIVLDWRLLGYGFSEPWDERSGKKQRAFMEGIRDRAARYLSEIFLPQMKNDFASNGLRDFSLTITATDSQTIRFFYPQVFADDALLQEIRLEAGALSAWTPSQQISITPYAAQLFPQAFNTSNTTARAMKPERTFWEKVTILHKEAFRDAGAIPSRYSRHYYDMYELCNSYVKDAAFASVDLLGTVVDFKSRFFRSASAHYELAKPGTLRLIPPADSMAALRRDYASMQSMIYGECPEFETIIDSLRLLENEINLL
ncbi:MAG: nucleotidyl transferase AbiEii/AbiGii toxin family protein [Coriobacteriia bacterium]|nr:nucleotidyl transferase AbiEii/AbiGii toxin family protein [Coriobacteriia bacterium]